MTKVLILYYSAYGHTERMAQAVAEGVREAGAEAEIKRVPELVSEDVAKQSGYKLDQKAPIATVAEFAQLRCDHFWVRDPVRRCHLADA
jgi:NAD(P)H dehydrogenase (quinone)